MKKLTLMLIIVSFVISSLVVSPVSAEGELVKLTLNGKQYIRTFYDEFGGTNLDSTKWSFAPEWDRQNGYCKWSNSMTSLDGKGHLVLKCDYDENGDLLCGAVRTRDLFQQKYGYFEISVKLQQVEGFWSAFWLMPNYIDTGITGGSDGTEIDIYEAFSVSEKKINYAIHYDGYGSNHKSMWTQVVADVYDGQFHNFALEWDENQYSFFIDGEKKYTITSDEVDICKVATYMKISLESGSWTELPDQSDMPSGILVDYVKAYQRADLYVKENVVYGDLDSNLEINMTDVKLLREYIAGREVTINKNNANMYRDSKIDMKDYLIFRKYQARLITSLPYKENS